MDPQPEDAAQPADPAPAPRRALKDIRIESRRRTGRASRTMSYGRIAFGSVLGRTFTIYGKGFLPIILMSFIVYAPLVAYTLWVFRALPTAGEAASLGFDGDGTLQSGPARSWSNVYFWAQLLLGYFLAGPITYLVVNRLRGRAPGLGDSLRVGLARIPRILLTALLLGVYILGVLFAGGLVVGIPLALAMQLLGRNLGAIVFGAAYALGILWILSMFWVAIPVAVVEEGGASEAIRRSVRLTKRNVWKIVAINTVLFLAGFALDRALKSLDRGDLDSLRLMALGQVLVSAVVTGPLGAVAAAVGYHDLRTSAEAIGTEEIARVFE